MSREQKILEFKKRWNDSSLPHKTEDFHENTLDSPRALIDHQHAMMVEFGSDWTPEDNLGMYGLADPARALQEFNRQFTTDVAMPVLPKTVIEAYKVLSAITEEYNANAKKNEKTAALPLDDRLDQILKVTNSGKVLEAMQEEMDKDSWQRKDDKEFREHVSAIMKNSRVTPRDVKDYHKTMAFAQEGVNQDRENLKYTLQIIKDYAGAMGIDLTKGLPSDKRSGGGTLPSVG